MIKRLNDSLIPLALGGMATLGFAPFDWYGLTLVAVAGLIGLWWDVGPGRAAWRGWLFGLGHFATGLYWIYISTYYYGGAPQALAVFLPVLLSVVLALFIAGVGAFAGFTRHLPRPLWALLLVPAAWLLAELLRSRIGTGFPWLSLGYSLTNAPLTSLPPLVGVYGLSALMMAAAGALTLLVAGSIVARGLAVGLFAALPLGIWLLPPALDWTSPAGEPVTVTIVQGGISQDQKWLPENRGPTLTKYRQIAEATDARLVIWPEVAIPALEQQVTGYLRQLDQRMTARGQTLVTGLLVKSGPDAPLYNSVIALGLDSGRYHKRHLVPYGEYFPVPDFLLPLLKGVNLRYSNFAHGPEEQELIRIGDVALGISICFEDAFGYEIRKSLPEAGLLVNLTNDAWFADSTAPHQHFQIARMRVLESGRPLLRAANTGISAVIGADGKILTRGPQFEEAVVNAIVQPRQGATPYVRYGDKPLWMLALGLMLIGLIAGYAGGYRRLR